MNDGEDINICAGSGRKTAVNRDSLRDAIRSTFMRQYANRLGVGAGTLR